MVLGVGVLAACTSASNSGSTTPTSNPTTPITIGASLSLSGGASNPFQADGLAFQKGYDLWVNDVNDHGGLLGRKTRPISPTARGCSTRTGTTVSSTARSGTPSSWEWP